MKKVVTTPAVDLALRTLGREEVRRVHAWFDHLANWDDDPFVRENSHTLADVPGVRVPHEHRHPDLLHARRRHDRRCGEETGHSDDRRLLRSRAWGRCSSRSPSTTPGSRRSWRRWEPSWRRRPNSRKRNISSPSSSAAGNLDDYKKDHGFTKTFGYGHLSFTGLLMIGRSAGLDDMKRTRLRWRADKALVDSHAVICVTFDDAYETLKRRYAYYKAAAAVEKELVEPPPVTPPA